MSLAARAIALNGIGYSALNVALDGFADVIAAVVTSGGGVGGKVRRVHGRALPGLLPKPRRPVEEDEALLLLNLI